LNLLQSFTFFGPHRLPLRHIECLAACAFGLALSLASLPATAQAPVPAVSSSSPATVKPATHPKPSPTLTLPSPFAALDWKTLTPAQQVALKPLAGSWAALSDPQKRKWISLSANFERMTPADQAKLHERMEQWAALSPRQREQARLNFAEAQKIAPQQKTEKWQAYQALSPEEKQRLATSMRPKPPRTALAPQPVASGKLNLVTLKPGMAPLTAPKVSAPALPSSSTPNSLQPETSAAAPAISHGNSQP